MVTVDLILQAVNSALNGCGAVCGDGHVDSGEDCDDGGTCIGGTNAGTYANATDGVDIKPFSVTARPLNCANPLNPLAGATFADAYTALNVDLFGDVVVTYVVAGQ